MFDTITRWLSLTTKQTPQRKLTHPARVTLPSEPPRYRHPPPKGPRRPLIEPPHDHFGTAGAGRGVEPAMAVIPRDALQMPPPRAAAPGLPPVDLVETAVAATPATNSASHPEPELLGADPKPKRAAKLKPTRSKL